MHCVVLNFNFMTHQKTIIIGLLKSVLILAINSKYFGNMEMMNIYSLIGIYRDNYPIEINFGIFYVSC